MTEGTRQPASVVSISTETGEATLRESISRNPCGNFDKETDPVPLPDFMRQQFEQMQLVDPDNPYVKEALEVGMTHTGDDVWCTRHIAEELGLREERIAELGLVRGDLFDLYSVERLKDEGYAIERKQCDATWFGTCLWPIGEVIHFAANPDSVQLLLTGQIEVDEEDVHRGPAVTPWDPDRDLS